jgi:predicted phosphodiesterase
MKISIMSDIHGNIEALKSVGKVLDKNKVNALVLLGDIIDYCPHSNEAIECVYNLPYKVLCNIIGNHEEAILNERYDRFSSNRGRDSALHTRQNLNKDSWNYIKSEMSSKAYCEFEVDNKKCLAIHGSLEDPAWKAITPKMDLEGYRKYDYVFSGHSHLPHVFAEYYDVSEPLYRNIKRTMFINPGSVGQPRNHNPRAQFAIWDTFTDEIKLCCVDYDIKKEQAAFSNNVDIFYKERLEVGV